MDITGGTHSSIRQLDYYRFLKMFHLVTSPQRINPPTQSLNMMKFGGGIRLNSAGDATKCSMSVFVESVNVLFDH